MVSAIFSFQFVLKLEIPYMDRWVILEVCTDWSMCATCVPTPAQPPVSQVQMVTKF